MKITLMCNIFLLLLNCSIVAPKYGESNMNYTIVCIFTNKTGNVLSAESSNDTVEFQNLRSYTWSKAFDWLEDNENENDGIMIKDAVDNLTETINFKDSTDYLIDKITVRPKANVGDKINSNVVDVIRITIE